MKRLIAAACLTALTLPAQESGVLKVYTVRYEEPAAAVELIPSLLSSTNGLKIQAAGSRLIVRASPEQHSEIAALLAELDRPPKNVQINVRFSTATTGSAYEAGVRPRGPIIVRDGGLHASLEGRFADRRTASTENTEQMLVAMDGRSATLRVGESVPHLAWIMEYGCRHGVIREMQVEWIEVGSFLAVYPEIIGDGPEIRIRLIPELSGRLQDGTAHSIQFTELATEVIAADGQTLSLGGFDQNREFYSKFLIGRSGGGETAVTDITLTPRILP